MNELQTIPARHGRAVRVKAGKAVTVINTSGTQVVDTWAFCADDLAHFMSMEHSRVENGRLLPVLGGAFYTNLRAPILTLEADTSAGVHDTIMAACDARRYERLGCAGFHRNCTDNLQEALAALGVAAPTTPSPLNLFMNIPIHADGTLEQGPPPAKPGDSVTLRAMRDCIVAFSACPQDMTPINGMEPTDAHFRLEG